MAVPLQLRKNLGPQSCCFEHAKALAALPFRQNPSDLFANALGTDLVDFGSHCTNGIPGASLDRVAEPRAKTDGAKYPQFIFLKSCMRITNRTNDLCRDV